ncbi:MAG: MarR family transcriptional regulator [Candidatus Woykebacteria bacterium]
MDKNREELLEKLFKEMIYTFRSLKPEGHNFSGYDHHWSKRKFGRGHMDLFFRLMKEKEGVFAKDLADSLCVTPGAITQIVDGAVKGGMVTRMEDPADRRFQKIKLSDKAKSKIEGFKKNYFEKLEPRFSSLSDGEISQLSNLLAKVNSVSAEKEAVHE